MSFAHLPAELGELFAVRQARAAGVSSGRLRSRTLHQPYRGVRQVPEREQRETLTPQQHHLRQARAYALRMTEHEFFSHVTSAVIWDLPLPLHVLADGYLDVAVHSPRRNPRGRGVRGHEVDPRLATVVTHPGTGLRVASPASTWAMLGSVLRNPYDLVSTGDAAVREPWHPDDPPALTTTARLSAAAAAGRRVGIGALRAALPNVRTRSASRPETWMRLILTDAGLPEPLLNWPVHGDRGEFLGFVDQAYPELKIAIEYEGEQHRIDPGQWLRDIARYERLAEAGWRVIRVTKHDVFTAAAPLVARVRRTIAQATR